MSAKKTQEQEAILCKVFLKEKESQKEISNFRPKKVMLFPPR
jgi:hypothetical protein